MPDFRNRPHSDRPKPKRCAECGAASYYLTGGRCDHRGACEARQMLRNGATATEAARHAQRLP
jgi:hypothetical protein